MHPSQPRISINKLEIINQSITTEVLVSALPVGDWCAISRLLEFAAIFKNLQETFKTTVEAFQFIKARISILRVGGNRYSNDKVHALIDSHENVEMAAITDINETCKQLVHQWSMIHNFRKIKVWINEDIKWHNLVPHSMMILILDLNVGSMTILMLVRLMNLCAQCSRQCVQTVNVILALWMPSRLSLGTVWKLTTWTCWG